MAPINTMGPIGNLEPLEVGGNTGDIAGIAVDRAGPKSLISSWRSFMFFGFFN